MKFLEKLHISIKIRTLLNIRAIFLDIFENSQSVGTGNA